VLDIPPEDTEAVTVSAAGLMMKSSPV